MNELTSFPQRLSQAIIDNGLNQTRLAQMMGTTQQTISNWVKGINEPGFNNLLRLCFYLDEEPNYLLGYDIITKESFAAFENGK